MTLVIEPRRGAVFEPTPVKWQQPLRLRFAILRWAAADGIADALGAGLEALGHQAIPFIDGDPLPQQIDVVLTFAPYGDFLHVLRAFAQRPQQSRPLIVHWNFEEMPDQRIPQAVLFPVAQLRSWFGRLPHAQVAWQRQLGSLPIIQRLTPRMRRLCHLGDYQYACARGWIDVLADISCRHVNWHQRNQTDAFYLPFGAIDSWHADLQLERDIDVLWMGKRRNKRRSDLIDCLHAALSARGLRMHIADDVVNPFIFGETRTRMLNRAKITLNLMTRPSDNTLGFRFPLAAANRSLLVSEPTLNHNPEIVTGTHYVEAKADKLVDTILYYVRNSAECTRLTTNAHTLATTDLTLENSLHQLVHQILTLKQNSRHLAT